MLIKIAIVIFIIWAFIKLVKIIGKKIIFVIIILLIAFAAMSQNTDTSKTLSESFKETKEVVVSTTNEIVKSKEFKEVKKTTLKATKKTVKAVAKGSATIDTWFREGWNETKKN